MSYQIELRHLVYFSTLAEELHFRKAAERLFISQPGLTRQIKQMEALFEVTLFERDKRQVHLTEAGRFLKTETDLLLSQLTNISQRLKKMGEGKTAILKIGFVGSAAPFILPTLLAGLESKAPDIEVNLSELSHETQTTQLLDNKLDFGFSRVSAAPPGLSIKKIKDESFALVVPPNHKILSVRFHSLKQVENERFILFSPEYSTEYYDLVMSIFKDSGFVPNVHHKTVNALTIFKLVEKGLGVAIVPASLKEGYETSVQFIELNSIKQTSQLSLIWNPKNRNPGVATLLNILNKSSNAIFK